MSESLTNEKISVQKTEDVNEKEEEEISLGNTSREVEIQNETLENLTKTKDTTIEEVPDVSTDITKSPQKSSSDADNIIENKNKDISFPIKNSPQSEDDDEKTENLKEVIDTTAEELSEENPSSSDAATEIIKSSLNSSATHEHQDISSSAQVTPEDKDSLETFIEKVSQDKVSPSDISSSVQETPEDRDSLETFTEEVSQDKVSSSDISSSVQDTPKDKDSLETSTEEVSQEKVFPSDIITETIKSPLKSSPTEETPPTDTSSSTQVSPQVEEIDSFSKDTTKTLNKPLKSSLTEENEDIDSTSSAQEPSQEKDSSDTPTNITNSSCIKPSSKDDYAEHVTYCEDGSAIYTDPQTKFQYKWCTKANNWIPCDSNSTTENPYENEHYKWCSETQKWLPKNTQVTETEYYKWDPEKNEWIAKFKDLTATSSSSSFSSSTSEQSVKPSEIIYDIDEDGHRTYTDKDGATFFWDVDKNAWFPKIDDDFMARYQMSYGFIDNTSESEREKEKREQENQLLKEKELEKLVEEAKANDEAALNDNQGVKRKGQQEPPKWFDIDPLQNTKVYISNLPLDITLDEFSDVMGKCGMIMRDPQTQKYKLKLYTEADGQIKGDGLCDYIKVESVDLALKILDEYELRGHKIRVQRAQFQMRGEYNPSLKPKRKKKDKEKLAKIKEKLFDWRPEKMRGERSKHEKTVIIKNLFHPELFEKEVQLILDYQNDLREECGKCGTVRKVVIYDRHSEGVAQINMSSPEEADLVIQMMQGRFFGKRQLTAEHWDGKTKYKVDETEEEVQKRLNKWDQYLETDESKKSDLQKDEQDIEKSINFENSQVTPKVKGTQILEENFKEE